MVNVASPIRQCGWLLLVTLAATAILALPATLVAGWAGLLGLGVSAVVCLVPGLVVVGLATSAKDPSVRIWFVLGGMIVRMFAVLVVVLVVRQLQPQLGLREFYIWVVAVYSVMLLAETWLLLPRTGGSRP